jgi:formate-dependent phosphoribosylglycinamide formyltransferase (GAR transformylase)
MNTNTKRQHQDNMNKSPLARAVSLAMATSLITGCVSVHKVAIKDAPRTTVSFESAEAMQTFYTAVLARHFPNDGKPSRVVAGQTLYTWETRPSSNVVFNDAVAAADSDGDKVISESEATTFGMSKTK